MLTLRAVGLLALALPLAAQDVDELLVVERPQDRAGRARLVKKLASMKITLNADELAPTEVAKVFAIAAGGDINVAVMSKAAKPSELEPITVSLKDHGLIPAMGVIRDVSDLQFVYRAGMLLLKPKDEVKQLTVLRIYDIRAAIAQLRDHPGPKLGLGSTGTEYLDFEDVDSEKTLSGWNADEIQDMIRNHIDPESWDAGNASISMMSGSLMVRQTAANQKKVQALLIKLGAIRPAIVKVVRPARAKAPKQRRK